MFVLILIHVGSTIYFLLMYLSFVFFCKQKTAYEMRISDWSSDVCSSDLLETQRRDRRRNAYTRLLVAAFVVVVTALIVGMAWHALAGGAVLIVGVVVGFIWARLPARRQRDAVRAHEIGRAHAELQSLMRLSLAVFVVKQTTNR